MKVCVWVGLVGVMSAGCGGLSGQHARAAPMTETSTDPQSWEALTELLDDYERVERAFDPVTAAQDGDRAALSRMPDARPEARQVYEEKLAALAVRLSRVDVSGLSEESALDHALLEYTIELTLEASAFDFARMPFQSDEGFHTLADYLGRTTKVHSLEDAQAWLARLGALPAYYAQNFDNLRRGIATGYTQPRLVVERVIAVARAQAATEPKDSPLLEPLAHLPDTISAELQRDLRARALSLVTQQIAPAQRAFVELLEQQYLPAARAELAWRSLPMGDASYRFLVRRETTTALSPEEIHQIGLDEVERIRALMHDTMRDAGFDGTLAQFIAMLRRDPRFYPESGQELLEKASEIAKRADDSLPSLFGRLPRLPYGVRPVPNELAEGYTSGRYWPGSPALGQAGGYMVNLAHLDQRPLYELPALTLHEAVPGHHLQIALAQELQGLPYVRRNAAPTAFIEGWGLYAEFLGEELGLYRDPYERFGRYSFEMWRACRLVADTGIHWLGWDLERARSCFQEHTALAPHNIQTELERYVAWPAQALGYKVGELRLRALRERAQAALGADFDIRGFHDRVLLGGALPLDLLDARVSSFVSTQVARRGHAQGSQGQALSQARGDAP